MKNQNTDNVEKVAEWLEESGFKGDLSPLTAGLHDIHSSIEKIYDKLLPALLQLNASQKDDALSIVVDLWVEMEHIGRHADSTTDVLTAVRDLLDES
jgi:hypothetical protein